MLKIISGGQTGADIAGLIAAKKCGFDTGGCAANGYQTENGAKPEYAKMYNLVDKHYDYHRRTVENVKMSDFTLIFADNVNSPGTKLTISACNSNSKPYLINPKPLDIVAVIQLGGVITINIAGNRESVAPGITSRTEKILIDAFRRL